MAHFTKVVLFTGTDGRARFREELVPLPEGTPQARFSVLMPSGCIKSTAATALP